MELNELLTKLNLQEEVSVRILKLYKENHDFYQKYISNLINKETSLLTYQLLEEEYKFDSLNLNILCIYLLSALKTYNIYKEKGINDSIFFDTMKCFTRFIDECNEKNGRYYFDRGFWTYRQVNMSLFRIGVLEYEFTTENTISIHIPSDAILTRENIDLSLRLFDEFLSEFYPQFYGNNIYCDSWLLSPILQDYLPSVSRIKIFQSYFEIIEIDNESLDIFEWVFKVEKNYEISLLPENTSLQRNCKKAMLEGKKIGKALGILKKK